MLRNERILTGEDAARKRKGEKVDTEWRSGGWKRVALVVYSRLINVFPLAVS